MSKNEKVTEQAEQKVVTKYDRKMQKREEQKKKEKQEKLKSNIITTVIVIALICFIAYFPIRSFMATNSAYVTVGGEDVSQVEFEYNYNVVMSNYVSQYGSYLSYFGLDTTQDMSTQMYSDTLSWKDYFEQMAVDNLIQTKAVMAKAEAEGFTYDPAAEYEEFVDALKDVAAENGVSTSNYVKQIYGSYATLNRIKPFIEENIILSAYYEKLAEDFAPSDDEIQTYYDENKSSYDKVDYRMTTVAAELSEEPTEDEITAAMEDAMLLAEEAEASVETDGELVEGATYSATNYNINTWLFDEAREAGDTTVIEDTANHQYYVLAFEQRYLDQTPSVDVRVIVPEEKTGEEILTEWSNGAATEESFAELAKEYSSDSTAVDGGLCEGTTSTGMPEELSSWLFDAARAKGDTTSITTTDGYTFVMYYIGENEPEWKLSIKNTLANEELTAYVDEAIVGYEVEDTKGNLNYLKVEAAEAETVEGTESTENADTTESTTAAE